MNITKQQWTIIGVVVAIILVWYFFLRKKTVTKQESGMFDPGGSWGTSASGWGKNVKR